MNFVTTFMVVRSGEVLKPAGPFVVSEAIWRTRLHVHTHHSDVPKTPARRVSHDCVKLQVDGLARTSSQSADVRAP